MANKVVLELNINQVEKLVDNLPIEDKIRLARKLETQTWPVRLDAVVGRVRKRFKKIPISDKEIRQICEETRQRLYDERTKSCNR